MQQHYNHSRRRVLRRRRIMVIAAAILLVAAVVFAVVHWVIPALNKEINPPDPTTQAAPEILHQRRIRTVTMLFFIRDPWCRKASR